MKPETPMSTNPHYPDATPKLPRPMPRPRPPINVLPLEYYRPDPAQQKPRVPLIAQFVLGVALVPALIAAGVATMAKTRIPPDILVLLVPALAAICIVVRLKLKWKAFFPGVLTAIFLIPLVLVVTVLVACGVIRF